MKLIKIAGLAAMTVLSTVAVASAADLARRAPPPAPVYVPPPAPLLAYNWTGFYLGANGGYGWGTNDADTIGSFDIKGGFAGGQVGYNFMMSPGLLLGIEADADWSDIKGDCTGCGGVPATITQDVKSFGTVRGRIGLPMGNLLPYATAGWAWANEERSTTVGGGSSDTQNHNGYAVGAGVEMGLTQNVTAKIEYQYLNLGSQHYNLGLGGNDPNVDTKISTIRLGINFKL